MIPRSVKQLGLAGCMGMALLAAAGWAQWAWLPRQQDAVDQLGSQGRRLRYELQQASTDLTQGDHGARIPSPQAAWDVLWQGLPLAHERVRLQSTVLALARDHGVLVRGVQYQGARAPWASREGAVLWRQRMVMPVSGTYPAIKAWMAQLLEEPALSIDELSLQRSDAASDQLQARVAVSLWWRQSERARP